MEAKKTNIGITYGLISGLASVIFTLLLYLNGAKAFVSPMAWLGFAIPIVIGILAGIKQKKIDGGYIDFAAALKVVFMTFVIGTIISIFFNYLLFNVIDIPFREALTQESTEKMQEWMVKFGTPQEAIDKATEEALKGNNYSLGSQTLSGAFICIVWFIISLIIAAIIKKKKPEFPAAQ